MKAEQGQRTKQYVNVQVPSDSKPGTVYYGQVSFQCGCPAATLAGRSCKHEAMILDLIETALKEA